MSVAGESDHERNQNFGRTSETIHLTITLAHVWIYAGGFTEKIPKSQKLSTLQCIHRHLSFQVLEYIAALSLLMHFA